MFERIDAIALGRNLGVYTVGVAAAVVGALGLAGAIVLHQFVAGMLLVLGLLAVLVVHEFWGGPI